MPEHTAGASRRDFLKGLAAIGVGALGAGCASSGGAAASSGGAMAGGAAGGTAASRAVRPTIDRAGVGLFTVFGELRQDFDGTLAQIRQIGYREVEFAGYYDRTPEQVRATLDRVGLTSPSTHIGLDLLRSGLDAQIRSAQVIGHTYITVPSLPRGTGAMRSADDWKRVAEEFNRIGRQTQAAGIKLAFHTHRDEFVDVGGGKKGMDVFIAETDPALVAFELDLGWARVAGEDPVQWFSRYPGRFPMWHVKDIKGLADAQAKQAEAFRNPPPPPAGPPAGGPPAGGPPMGGMPTTPVTTGPAPLGEGEVNYKPILAAWQSAGLQHYFVEQDLAMRWEGGAIASLRKSYQTLSQWLA